MSDYVLNRDLMDKCAVFRGARVTKNLPDGAAGDALVMEITYEVKNGAFLQFLFLDVPNFTNGITITVTVEDQDAQELYNSGAKAKNAKYAINLASTPIPLNGAVTVKLTASGDPGANGGDVKFTPWFV